MSEATTRRTIRSVGTWQNDPKKKGRIIVRWPPESGVHAGAVAFVSKLKDFYFWTASVSIDSHYSYTESGDANTLPQATSEADTALYRLAQKAARHHQRS